jgi:hypothetical protein
MFQNEKNTVPGIQSETDSVSCSEWRVIQRGVSCVFASDTPLQLDFPKVDLESVLAGNEFLPRAEKVFQLGEIVTAHGQYRNIRLNLRWEPITPDFLQIYLKE